MEKEVPELERRLEVKRSYSEKIGFFLSRKSIDDSELYSLVRKFFSELLKLDYEFTYEELSIELNKVFIRPDVKERIDSFLLELSNNEYLEEAELSPDDIKGYLADFQGIINDVIFEKQEKPASETVIDRVLHLKHLDAESARSSVSSMIDEARFYISSGNLQMAKSSYKSALAIYDNLPKALRKEFGSRLKALYSDIELAYTNPGAFSKNAGALDSAVQIIGLDTSDLNPSAKMSGAIAATVDSERMLKLIDEAYYDISRSDAGSAKKSYASALRFYDSLSKDTRKLFFDKMNILYSDLALVISGKPPKNISKTDSQSSNRGYETHASEDMHGNAKNILVMDADHRSDKSVKYEESDVELHKAHGIKSTDPGAGPISKNRQPIGLSIEIQDNKNLLLGVEQSGNVEGIDATLNSRAALDNNTFASMGALGDFKTSSDPNLKTHSNTEASSTKESQGVLQPRDTKNIQGAQAKSIQQSPRVKKAIATPSRTVKTAALPNPYASSQTAPKTASYISIDNADIKTPIDISTAKSIVQTVLKEASLVESYLSAGELAKAKEQYKIMLGMYTNMDSKTKKLVYSKIKKLYSSLEDALHKASLSELIDQHIGEHGLGQRGNSQGFMAGNERWSGRAHDAYVGGTGDRYAIYPRDFGLVPVDYSDLQLLRLSELVEESYFNLDNGNTDLAMLKYFTALNIYHGLKVPEKRRAYLKMYMVYKRLHGLQVLRPK